MSPELPELPETESAPVALSDPVGERRGHDERLRREQRLRLARDFQAVRRGGRRLNSDHLTLSYARRSSPSSEPARIAFVTSKKVGKAVARNRVRRWLRESIRRQWWHVAPGWDMIISARSGAAEREYATLDAEVGELLARAHLFTDVPAPNGAWNGARRGAAMPQPEQTGEQTGEHA